MFAVHVKATPRCEMGPKAAKSSVFIGSGRDTEDHPNAAPKTVSLSSPGLAVHVKATPRCEMGPQAAKSSVFIGSGRKRLTLKITPTQVQKRCPWARQAMLFPCCGGGVFGKPFRLAVEVHRKATSRCDTAAP